MKYVKLPSVIALWTMPDGPASHEADAAFFIAQDHGRKKEFSILPFKSTQAAARFLEFYKIECTIQSDKDPFCHKWRLPKSWEE